MLLDRRVTLSWTRTTGTDRAGRPVTETVDREVWATKIQDGVSRSLEVQGSYSTAARTYRLRYAADLLRAAEAGATIKVVDDGLEQVVQGVGEPVNQGRRRFLDVLIREGS